MSSSSSASTDEGGSDSSAGERARRLRCFSVAVSGADVTAAAAGGAAARTAKLAEPGEDDGALAPLELWQRRALDLLHCRLDATLDCSGEPPLLEPGEAEGGCDDGLRVFGRVARNSPLVPGGLLLQQCAPLPAGAGAASRRRAARPRRRGASDSEDEPRRTSRALDAAVDGAALLASAREHALRGAERVQAQPVTVVEADSDDELDAGASPPPAVPDAQAAADARRKERRKEKRRLAAAAEAAAGPASVAAAAAAVAVDGGACPPCNAPAPAPAPDAAPKLSQRERKRRNRQLAEGGGSLVALWPG